MKTNRRQFLKSASMGVGVGVVGGAKVGLAQASKAPAKSFVRRAPTLRLGMVTYNLGSTWNVDTLIKNCITAKFEGVELRTTHGHKVEVNLALAERHKIRDRFQESGVELMGLGSVFDFHTPDAAKLRADIEGTRDYMKLAHDVGAGGIKVRPNDLPAGVPEEKTLEQIGKALRELGGYGDGLGIQIRLEVHGKGTSLLPNIKKIMDVADHPMVGVCWNSNDTDLAGAGFDANFDLVKDRIFTVHMRDLYLEEYPFRRLLARLSEIGYRGYCLAEIPQSMDPVRVMHYYRSLWLAYQDLL